MSKAILVIDMPKNCRNCPLCDTSGGYGDWWCLIQETYLSFQDDDSEKRENGCPLKPYTEYIPIENIEFLMKDGEIYSGRKKIEATIEPFNKLVWDNYVAYNREWLRKRASEEFNIVTGKQAIPIEWLKKYAKKKENLYIPYSTVIMHILEDWEKENEKE